MAEPTTPPPDVKDWTWAITEPCPECGFDPASVTPEQVPALTRRHAASLHTAVRA